MAEQDKNSSVTATSKLAVTLDGGKTWQSCPDGVRVTIHPLDVDGEDTQGELTFNFTEEGLITDVWCAKEDADYNAGTSCGTYSEVVCRLVQENN
jgi:hypothetical protein